MFGFQIFVAFSEEMLFRGIIQTKVGLILGMSHICHLSIIVIYLIGFYL